MKALKVLSVTLNCPRRLPANFPTEAATSKIQMCMFLSLFSCYITFLIFFPYSNAVHIIVNKNSVTLCIQWLNTQGNDVDPEGKKYKATCKQYWLSSAVNDAVVVELSEFQNPGTKLPKKP